MSRLSGLFLEALLQEIQQDEPGIVKVLNIEEIPEETSPDVVYTSGNSWDGVVNATGYVSPGEVTKPAKVRITVEDKDGEMYFFDHEGTFSNMLLEMVNPGLAVTI